MLNYQDTFLKELIIKFYVQNEIANNHNPNGHCNENGYLESLVEEQEVVPGTSLTLEDYDEKSVLVSANYGSNNVWIRLVGQNADVKS